MLIDNRLGHIAYAAAGKDAPSAPVTWHQVPEGRGSDNRGKVIGLNFSCQGLWWKARGSRSTHTSGTENSSPDKLGVGLPGAWAPPKRKKQKTKKKSTMLLMSFLPHNQYDKSQFSSERG